MRCLIGELFTFEIFTNAVMKVWTTIEPETPSIVNVMRTSETIDHALLLDDQFPAALILGPHEYRLFQARISVSPIFPRAYMASVTPQGLGVDHILTGHHWRSLIVLLSFCALRFVCFTSHLLGA
jgi:hypothetical protein